MDPSKVLVVTTGSQAEPRAQLSLASQSLSHNLKINPSDLVLYSAKVIPGNEGRVTKMINSLAGLGAEVAAGRAEGLHTSGHAYQEELTEVLRFVKPQHFLPVHGEYSFLCEHAKLARESAGVKHVDVIRNGQLLGIGERRSRGAVAALGSVAAAEAAAVRSAAAAVGGGARMNTTAGARPGSGQMAVLGEATLYNFFNDGGRGTGTAEEMALTERTALAVEGVVVAAVDVLSRTPAGGGGGGGGFSGGYDGDGYGGYGGSGGGSGGGGGGSLTVRTRITTRGMWLDRGALLPRLHGAAKSAAASLPASAPLGQVERAVAEALGRACKAFNNRRPEVIVVAYEGGGGGGGGGFGGGGGGGGGRAQQQALQQQQQQQQQAAAPRPGRAPRPWEEGAAAAAEERGQQGGDGDEEDDGVASTPPPAEAAPKRRRSTTTAAARGSSRRSSTTSKAAAAAAAAASAPTVGTLPPLEPVPEGMLERRRRSNPRENPEPGADVDFD
jgi:hypothetical protein